MLQNVSHLCAGYYIRPPHGRASDTLAFLHAHLGSPTHSSPVLRPSFDLDWTWLGSRSIGRREFTHPAPNEVSVLRPGFSARKGGVTHMMNNFRVNSVPRHVQYSIVRLSDRPMLSRGGTTSMGAMPTLWYPNLHRAASNILPLLLWDPSAPFRRLPPPHMSVLVLTSSLLRDGCSHRHHCRPVLCSR